MVIDYSFMKQNKRQNVFVNVIVFLITSYQKIFEGKPSTCRFIPSCSTYAIEAFQKHRFIKGFLLTGKRLFRCHPWGGYGVDSVPDEKRKVNV